MKLEARVKKAENANTFPSVVAIGIGTFETRNTWNLVGVTGNMLLVSLHVLMFERELDANQPQSPLNGVP